jgi:hypothetical protein
MIASPGDVAAERAIVSEEIYRWNDANAFTRKLVLLPVKWETHSTPQLGEHPQTIINRQLLDDADLVIGIFGTRIGTPTEDYSSGTVEEIKKHVAAGKTAKIYFSDVAVPPSSVNPSQYASVQLFRQDCQKSGLYATYNSIEHFRTGFGHHLNLELNQPRYIWLSAPQVPQQAKAADLSTEALRLVRAAASSDGVILTQETMDGSGVSTGGERFTDGSNRSAAKWKSALKQLIDEKAVETLNEGVHRVTDIGYDISDREKQREEASQPIQLVLSISGRPEDQHLHVESPETLKLNRLDFLTTSGACIITQGLSEEGGDIRVKLEQDKLIALLNSPRPDRNSFDGSGPAKLRLNFNVRNVSEEVLLPVMLQPKLGGSVMRIEVVGSETFRITR